MQIKYSCGMCGQPVDYKLRNLPIPENYNPDDYPHCYCLSCGNAEMELQEFCNYVTHKMAMDAGIPELEGIKY